MKGSLFRIGPVATAAAFLGTVITTVVVVTARPQSASAGYWVQQCNSSGCTSRYVYDSSSSSGYSSSSGGSSSSYSPSPPEPDQCDSDQIECGGSCCEEYQTCCDGQCCGSGDECCNGECIDPYVQSCCDGSTVCDLPSECCGTECCTGDQFCCEGECKSPTCYLDTSYFTCKGTYLELLNCLNNHEPPDGMPCGEGQLNWTLQWYGDDPTRPLEGYINGRVETWFYIKTCTDWLSKLGSKLSWD